MSHPAPCCQHVSTAAPIAVVDDPFTPMIVLDYYDGAVGGFLQCRSCGAAYHFQMLDWDKSHVVRIFALAPVPVGSVERVLALLQAKPDRHVWIPPILSRASEETLTELYEGGIQEVIDRAATPTVVIAWCVRAEKTLAMRGIEAAVGPHLSHLFPWFDCQPQPVVFDWFEYLRMAQSLQTA